MAKYKYTPDNCPGHHYILDAPDGLERKPTASGACKHCGDFVEGLPNRFIPRTKRRVIKQVNGRSYEAEIADITYSNNATPFF
tara:strand:+ start:164 stop:412 length:249 start_codon:yes stop_codon:yes gene_type:complete